MMEFQPSVVAASALLSAAYELFPIQYPAFRAAVSSCELVNNVLSPPSKKNRLLPFLLYLTII